MVLLNHSSPAYTELSYAIEKGLPAHGSSDAEDKLMDLGAAMQKATAVLSGAQSLSQVERSKEAIEILERGLGAFSSASDSDHTYNVIMAETAIRTPREALDEGPSDTNSNVDDAMSNLVRISMPTVDLDTLVTVRFPFYGLRMWIVSFVAKWLAWEPSEYSRNLFIAIEASDGQDKVCVAGGLMDTGLPISVLCCETAKRMEKIGGLIRKYDGPKPIFVTPNGTQFYSVGKIYARIRFDDGMKFRGGEWEVSERPLKHCEALIGTDLLAGTSRLIIFGAPGFPVVEPKPATASQREKETALQVRAAARKANEASISNLRNEAAQSSSSAHQSGSAQQYYNTQRHGS